MRPLLFRRFRWWWWTGIAALALLGLGGIAYLVDHLSSDARDSLETAGTAVAAAGTVVAAVAAAVAAASARSAAFSSSETARRATVALARHRMHSVAVSILHQDGHPDAAWYLYPYRLDPHEQEPALDLRVEWTANGRDQEVRRATLGHGSSWGVPLGIDASITAAEIHRRVGPISITYEDSDRLVRWRVQAHVTDGTYIDGWNPSDGSQRRPGSEVPRVDHSKAEPLPDLAL